MHNTTSGKQISATKRQQLFRLSVETPLLPNTIVPFHSTLLDRHNTRDGNYSTFLPASLLNIIINIS